MAFKTFTAGAVLTASDVNTYLAKQAVIVCTSTTRPSSPPEGMVIYETDTDKVLTYTTATTGWVPPWNLPWGYVGAATVTASQNLTAGSTSFADLTGLSVTFTPVQNRRYLARFFGPFYSSVANDTIVSAIRDASNNTLAQGGALSYTNTAPTGTVVEYNWTAASTSSVTVKVSTRLATGGTGTVTMAAAATIPATLVITDLGPNGAPS